MISSVDLACYGVSRAKDWVSVDCGTSRNRSFKFFVLFEFWQDWWFRLSVLRGWSGSAMVLSKFPVSGRPTIWMIVGKGLQPLQ